MKKGLLYFLTAIVFFVIGFSASTLVAKKDSNDAYLNGWKAAQERLKETSFLQQVEDDFEITSIVGKITEIKNNKILIKANPIEPLSDPRLDTREIKIDTNIEIFIIEEKEQDIYQKEIEEFDVLFKKEQVSPESVVVQPSKVYNKKISFSDLNIGDKVIVESNEDIKAKREFTTTKIVVYPF